MAFRKPAVLFAVCLGASLTSDPALAQRGPARGPLRVHPTNPRYFTDGGGRAIFLAGAHTWANLQDMGLMARTSQDPPVVFDYDAHLRFLVRHNHNFIRLWRWEVPKWLDRQWADDLPGRLTQYCEPHPWPRTGPGMARDGKPKFDLTRFHEPYFERLRARVMAARDQGIYVSVMLFEGWAVQFVDAWEFHPFKLENNVNGVDGDGLSYFMLATNAPGRRVLELQEAYIRKVADTVNDLDNVLYEVCNEAGSYSTAWQYHVIRYLKEYEAVKPKQHPVGMTFQYRGGSNQTLFDSPADWVSPNPGSADERYDSEPSGAYRGKVILSDTDHQYGHSGGDALWVWKSFCRGLNVLFMDDYSPSPSWQDSARAAMGQAVRYAEKMDLASMVPHDALSNTRYCLANPGREYLVFQPGIRGLFSVNLRAAKGECAVEWLNVTTGETRRGAPVGGGTARSFATPFPGPAVLYLKCGATAGAADRAPGGWEARAPREEVRPRFAYDPAGGRDGKGALVIETGDREGTAGFWTRTQPVRGGGHYRFRASRRLAGSAWPAQSAFAEIRWVDAAGKTVREDRPVIAGYLPRWQAPASPEYPSDRAPGDGGWTELSGLYRAPAGAAGARIDLRLQWAAGSRVEWCGVEFAEAPPPAPRKVKLAAVHLRPGGKTPEANRRAFAGLIAQAAAQGVDLVVLPETLTYYGAGLSFAAAAEPVPGPSTRFFGELARKHNLYLVAGLLERSGPLVYNVAVLLDPLGGVAGKFRKVTLPSSEVEGGVTPGREYPVFETRFGKLGMMICYDGFFPEVARELALRGAEVIAWPVWGCNPALARARAVENGVYLVSSTYSAAGDNWMLSAVWSPAGETIAAAKEFGTLAIAEVDLAEPVLWRGIGDFRAKVPRHLPLPPSDPLPR